MSVQPGSEFQPASQVYQDAAGRMVVQAQPVESVRVVPTVASQAQTVHTSYRSRFAPDAVITAVFGLALLLVGLLALTRAGTDGPMNDPVVKVLGFTHTETLGLIEIGFGALLLICGAALSRTGTLFFATVLGIVSFVGAVQATSFKKSLQLQSGLAWIVVIASIIVVAATLLIPRIATHSTRVVVQD